MANRNGGFIGTDGLDAPDPPTAVTPTAGNTQVSVAFTAPTDAGTSAITGFVAQVSTDGTNYSAGSNTGSSSPIVVSSLTNDTAATARVWAINAYGTSAPSDASVSFTPAAPIYGLYMGGVGSSNRAEIDLFDFASLGNASDYGDLTTQHGYGTGMGSATRAIIAGGTSESSTQINVIEYMTFATTGTPADFGNLTAATRYLASVSSSTRGIIGGGKTAATTGTNVMEYITIANTGNMTDFGDLSIGGSEFEGGCQSTTRGVFCGGDRGNDKVMDYITMASTGNATDFGDMNVERKSHSSDSNSTRGLMVAGRGPSNINSIDYITIASTGNASDFGDVEAAKRHMTAICNSTTLLACGGESNTNDCGKTTIASTGNTAYFGALTSPKNGGAGASNGHGGIA